MIAVAVDDVVLLADPGGLVGLLVLAAILVALAVLLVSQARLARAIHRMGERMDDSTLKILDALDAATNEAALATTLVASKLQRDADALAAALANKQAPDPEIVARLTAHATALTGVATTLQQLAADPANPVPAPAVPAATPTVPSAEA